MGIKADSLQGEQQKEPPRVAHCSGTRKCFLTCAFCLGSEDTEKTLRAPYDDQKQYLATEWTCWALLSLGPIFDWCQSMVYIKFTFLIMTKGNKRRTNENQNQRQKTGIILKPSSPRKTLHLVYVTLRIPSHVHLWGSTPK